ncbi:MAG: hypothetical protein KatS3mg002_0769 [Candidatus Woesearchaeota archaeon]|nr:MAG: hypothetical protein KatS3mg002_0769 [Candidatus Woesearchaeota archaeon]
MCGTTSNETVIFNTIYAKGELNICLSGLAEGIIEVTKDIKKQKSNTTEIKFQELPLEEFDLTAPDQIYGFNCEKCKEVIFTDTFPVICDCGHINNELVIHKQNLINRNKT